MGFRGAFVVIDRLPDVVSTLIVDIWLEEPTLLPVFETIWLVDAVAVATDGLPRYSRDNGAPSKSSVVPFILGDELGAAVIVEKLFAIGDVPVANVLASEAMVVIRFDIVPVDIVAIVFEGFIEAVLLAVDMIVAVDWLGTEALTVVATVAVVLGEIVVLLIIASVWFSTVVMPVLIGVVAVFEEIVVVLIGAIVWFATGVVPVFADGVVVVRFEAVVVILFGGTAVVLLGGTALVLLGSTAVVLLGAAVVVVGFEIVAVVLLGGALVVLLGGTVVVVWFEIVVVILLDVAVVVVTFEPVVVALLVGVVAVVWLEVVVVILVADVVVAVAFAASGELVVDVFLV